MEAILSEISPVHQTVTILNDCMDDLIEHHKPAFIEMIHNFKFLRPTTNDDEIQVPTAIFKDINKPLILTSNSTMTPIWKFQNNKRSTKIQAISYVIPIENIFNSNFDIITKIDYFNFEKDIFDTLPISSAIEYKWHNYSKYIVNYEIIKYFILLSSFTVYAILLGEDTKILFQGHNNTLCWIMLSVTMFISSLNIINKIIKIISDIKKSKSVYKGISKWLYSKFNLCEFITYIIILIPIPIMHFCRTDKDVVKYRRLVKLVSIVSFLLWWKTLHFFLPFRITGAMIIMIFEIIHDISIFIILAIVVMLGFGISFYILFRLDAEFYLEDDVLNAFGTISRSLVTTFAMMLGNFDQFIFYESQDVCISVLMFILYMIVMMIMLLNMLIAIMGNSFLKVKDKENANFLAARAEVEIDMDSVILSFLFWKFK